VRRWHMLWWFGLMMSVLLLVIFRSGEILQRVRLNAALHDLAWAWMRMDESREGRALDNLQRLAEEGVGPAAERLAWADLRAGIADAGQDERGATQFADPLMWWASGLASWGQSDVQSANEMWSRLLAARPRLLYALLWKVQMLPGDPVPESQHLMGRLAIQVAREDAQYLFAYLLAGDMAAGDDLEEAEEWYREAIERFPLEPASWFHWSKWRLAQGKFAEARISLSVTLALGGEAMRIFAVWGDTLVAEGRGAEAIAWYAKCVEQDLEAVGCLVSLEEACARYGPSALCAAAEE
jgi:tetratricopeptide (TPR) repeat protein